MIAKLVETRDRAYGFKVVGPLTTEDVDSLSKDLGSFIAGQKHPVGLLSDLSEMHGASWAARWHEMRFLQHHTDRIARMAVIAHDDWQQFSQMVLVATAALQAETRYFHSSELAHAWHWVRMSAEDEQLPVRVMFPGKGLFQDYTPDFA